MPSDSRGVRAEPRAGLEPDVNRLWAGVNDRLGRRGARRRTAAWAGGLLVAAAAVLLILLLLPSRRRGPPEGEPLALASGSLPSQLVGDPVRPQTDFRFADGSGVVIGEGAVVEVLENTGERFVTALRSGVSTFDVHPGGPRRWVIESGHVRVEVVGTKFTVTRSPGHVRVLVDHGVVLVRGDRVPDGVQRLTAGAELDVVEESSPSGSALLPPPPPTPAASDAPPVPPAGSPSARASEATAGLSTRAALREAERAETRGDVDEAISRLRTVVDAGGKDTRTAVASFSLARLLLARRPWEAAAVLRAALDRGMPLALEEDARARVVEAYASSGDHAAAEAAATEYLDRYPEGAHRAEVERWRGGQ
jgi:transmembrane sensor